MKRVIAPILLLAMMVALLACSQKNPTGPNSNNTATPSPANAPGADKEAPADLIDMIVNGDHVVTMNSAAQIIEHGAVAINHGMIVAVGPAADIAASYHAKETLAGTDRVVMPGLINGHTHAAMTLLRGLADDLALMDWLQNYIFPAEVEFVDQDFVRVGTELACWEMLRGGTTTFVDMYYFPDTIAQVVDQCGIRAMISATVIDQRSPDAEDAADSISKGIEFIKRWKGKNDRIMPIFGPHALYTVKPEQLKATRRAAIELGVPISIHLSESPFEVKYAKDHYGMTSIEFLDSIGFFDGPTIAAHVIWPTMSEIPILVKRKIGVIHNPSSNMKLASGIAPIAKLLAAGVRVGLGTDGAASNNDLDMWEEMRLASFLQKVDRMDPKVLPAQTVLNMATAGGATAIGLGDSIGTLEAGKRADLIQVAFTDVHHIPTYNVISQLVYVTDEQDVDTVIVDGKLVKRGDKFLTIDTDKVRREATAIAERIKAGIAQRNRAPVVPPR